MCTFEGLSAILTATRSYNMLRANGRPIRDQKGTFAYLVFTQSLQYFTLVMILTVLSTVFAWVATPGTFFSRLPNAFTLPYVVLPRLPSLPPLRFSVVDVLIISYASVSCLLTARFLLSLRQWESRRLHVGFVSTSGRGYTLPESQTVSNLHFAIAKPPPNAFSNSGRVGGRAGGMGLDTMMSQDTSSFGLGSTTVASSREYDYDYGYYGGSGSASGSGSGSGSKIGRGRGQESTIYSMETDTYEMGGVKRPMQGRDKLDDEDMEAQVRFQEPEGLYRDEVEGAGAGGRTRHGKEKGREGWMDEFGDDLKVAAQKRVVEKENWEIEAL